MVARNLIADLRKRGIRLRVLSDGERLSFGPKHLITPEVANTVKRHKAGIISAMEEDSIIRSEAEVFELAREYFGLDKPGDRA